MKFRCDGCGAIFYSDEPLRLCDFCGGRVREAAPARERIHCVGLGTEVKLICGIPTCEHFVLNNAPGNRCLYFALPRRCAIARLPEYQPRTGIVPEVER